MTPAVPNNPAVAPVIPGYLDLLDAQRKAALAEELRSLHWNIRGFYQGKDEAVLGNLAVYDPYFGWLNLIVTLRLGIYHDQLHYEDVIRLAEGVQRA
jgi:hypothetical protein